MNCSWRFINIKNIKLTITSLYLSTLLLSNTYASDYDALLMMENSVVSLCGELNYKRSSRNCAQAPNLRNCLDLNQRDPLYIYQESPSYNCVDSSYTAGVDIIKSKLEESEKMGGCLSDNFKHYYNDVIDSNEFMELARQFKEGLGHPIKLNYGIDIKDGLFNLQLDTENIEGSDSNIVNIKIGSFSEKGHCQKLSSKEVMAKITDEYNRLTLKIAKQDYNYYGEQPKSAKIFDASRFNGGTPAPSKDLDHKESPKRSLANTIAD